ncbi:hypothetical protein BLNAU_14493 [Blattamonas nauphoetae]|uniref:Uncharacterized protein n=1 Tax=Blattamonas nauphoetae TaxID=2049346 RepID=A0ABQ9XDP8_9EUKA|nr:hypothetical protein BLNAU_14493 [Blattamonas nauphoetae]
MDQSGFLTPLSQLRAELSESERKCSTFEEENKQLRSELANQTTKPAENEGGPSPVQQSVQPTKTEVTVQSQPIVASDVIVAFDPEHIRVSGSAVTKIHKESFWASGFTKPVSKGTHRLSIRYLAGHVKIGVLDAAEYPNYLTKGAYHSPKAAMMSTGGHLTSARQKLARNTKPEKGQEWSAEADLEKRTLHFFIDGVQQKHHFINIPVPLVFAIEALYKDIPIDRSTQNPEFLLNPEHGG